MKFNTMHLFGTAEGIWILTVQNHQIQAYYNTQKHAWVINPLALNLGNNRWGFNDSPPAKFWMHT
jgi:tRNA G18 (ribose-2'-O)-methylase SpoU